MSKLCSSIMKSLAALIFSGAALLLRRQIPLPISIVERPCASLWDWIRRRYDFYGRLVAAQLGKFVPGNPSVIVENMPGASSLKAAKMFITGPIRTALLSAYFLITSHWRNC